MRIGFDGKRAAQNRTGLGNYSRLVLRALSRNTADELCVYLPDERRTECLRGLERERGISLRHPQRAPWRWLRSLWRVWGVTADIEADGIRLFHGLSGELPLNIRRARGVRSVVTVHDLIFLRYPELYKPIDRWIYEFKFRRACRNADRIIAISECTKRDIVHFFGTPAEKIDVVLQGCDEAFHRAASVELQADVRRRYDLPPHYILYVGSIEERKNLMLLAQALPLLSDKAVQVVAVGKRTPYADRVQQYIDSAGLATRFRMFHGVPFADLPPLYQMADVFVYPSRFEGFGIPMLEALASGTAAIGCTGSCLEEAGGPDSIYVSPDSPADLAAAIDSVLADPALRDRMISQGRTYAARLSPAQMASDLQAVYNSVCESHNS